PVPPGVDAASFETIRTQQLKLLLELRGSLLSSDQVEAIRGLYRGQPAQVAACATPWAPPAASGCGDLTELNGTLAMCNALNQPNVPSAVAAALLPACRQAADDPNQFARLATVGCTAASTYINQYADLMSSLALKAFDSLPATSPWSRDDVTRA